MTALSKFVSVYKHKRNLLRFKLYYRGAAAVDLDTIHEIRNEQFPQGEPSGWLDKPNAERMIAKRERAGQLSREEALACRFWRDNGYLIFPGLIDAAELDAAWSDYEAALADGAFGDRVYVDDAKTLPDRSLDPHLKIPSVRALQHHPTVLKWTDLLLGRKTVPFQTIMGHAGSQQRAHSDSIHMTTYPLGFLVANWVAFETISADSGPLEYYPGSHRLPYLLSAEVGIPQQAFKKKGYSVYSERYEPMIARACEDAGLTKQVFLPKKGDVLFWHANLVHGGAPRTNLSASRKALVCHYFAKGVLTYHDLSGNASRLHKDGLYTPIVV